MPTIVSVGTATLPYKLKQDAVKEYTKELFSDTFRDIDRFMSVFHNGQIESRYFVKDLKWYKNKHTFSEKNDAYIENALKYGCEAINNCLKNPLFLHSPIDYEEIEAIFYISTLLHNAEDVMGWDIRDDGFFVIFSKDIPSLIRSWLKPNVEQFLRSHCLTMADIDYFIAHPGGKKVLEAYQTALGIDEKKIAVSFEILKQFGNMSSATVYFVLEQFMKQPVKEGEYGLLLALGPGFSSELVLLCWG